MGEGWKDVLRFRRRSEDEKSKTKCRDRVTDRHAQRKGANKVKKPQDRASSVGNMAKGVRVQREAHTRPQEGGRVWV